MNEDKRVVLYIDTASNVEVMVGLEREGEKDEVRMALSKQKAQVVLPMIDELLNKHGLVLQDITEISVNVGPGSFTGLRVGVSIANTLGSYLQIPINGCPAGTIVTPQYS